MEEWKEYKLIEVLDAIIDYRGKTPKKTTSGVPLITAKIIKNGRIETPTEFISVDDYDSWMVRGFPKVGDVVLTTEAPLGEVAQLDDANIALAQRVVTLRGKSDVLDNTYLKYYFLSNVGKQRLKARETGTTVTGIKQSELREVLVDVPPYKVQVRIAEVLKSLDDKIEVNRRINDNLEQQAQALFKSWFVDFEPFRDQPFVESELGMIPEGWRVVSFKDFIEASTEKAPVDCYPEYSVTNNGIIPRNSKFNKKLSKSSSKNKVLKKDELVFGMSREILNWGIMEDEVGGVSSAYNVYKIDKGIVSPTYLRLYMRARVSDFNSLIGTAAREGQGLDKGQLMNKHIYIPTNSALQDFLALFLPITEAQLNYENESRRLAELRDTLLPRLMSGELKVNEIENAI
ncbi:MAG: restriction endonuclease subunit S [Bacteroidaceae bacterium]|nr:restriction endonuclease subunit S [Bacteroidaceae bacterium]